MLASNISNPCRCNGERHRVALLGEFLEPLEEVWTELEALWVRLVDPEAMCNELFGITYTELQKVIYPNPSYKTFLIPKRNGDPRVITEPTKKLKELQIRFLDYLYEKSGPMKKCVHGFTRKRSIVTNARQHCSEKTHHLLNIDIQDFFPSISFYRVRGLLMSRPFNFSYSSATVLSQLCCYNNSLPQGAPTSPILANLICRGLDKELMSLASRHRAVYTRYCDDITFSFSVRDASRLPKSICSFESGVVHLGEEIQQIFATNSFVINKSKTRISNPRHRLEVTGLTINEFPNVKRKYIDEIRGALRAWKKFGYIEACKHFSYRKYSRSTRTANLPSLSNYLWGKLLFLKMVKGEYDNIYNKLAEEFNRLSCLEKEINEQFNFKKLPIASIVINQSDAELATFVVECEAEHPTKGFVYSQGTAFAYEGIGFLTCEHVLRYKDDYYEGLPNSNLTIMNAKTKQKWNVKVTYKNGHQDLALLEVIDNNHPNCKSFFGLEVPIKIGGKGILLGFPNYSQGKMVPNHAECRILNHFNRLALSRIEVSETIRQGNSGGPLVDEQYRLSGIVQHGATIDSDNNECLNIIEIQKSINGFLNETKEKLEKNALVTQLLKILQKMVRNKADVL
jgi:hypothetical protein